ncbi:MAG TPA: hypothetical protein VID27_13045, partial [Blastocatellia bacterium]
GLSASARSLDQDNSEKKDKKNNGEKQDKSKSKESKTEEDDPNAGRAILWTEPDIENLDLFKGPGDAPDPSDKFTFIRRDPGGTSEKIIVEDSKGRKWKVKFGPEARPETAATRLVWAAGYHVDQTFFVKSVHIEGRGGFDIWDVRFERNDDGFKNLGPWSWRSNKFAGTKELNGLKTLMALINNWDIKDENNKIVRPNKESGLDRNLRIYYVSDLGGTLGATGNGLRKIPGFSNLPAGSKGKPNAFAAQPFITGVANGEVIFNYKGKNREALKGVPVEHARWMGNLLGRLSDKQLGDAFRASDFTESETATYVKALRSRIRQLQELK